MPPRYYGMRLNYRRLLVRNEAQHREKLLEDMYTNWNVNPNKWGTQLRKLNNQEEPAFVPKEISLMQWFQHFQELLNEQQSSIQVLGMYEANRYGNEMIQLLHCAQPTFLPLLFTHIFQTGILPTEWSKSYLRPLYKKGDKLIPANYRGIAISPCIWKAFNAVINLRMEQLMDEKERKHCFVKVKVYAYYGMHCRHHRIKALAEHVGIIIIIILKFI